MAQHNLNYALQNYSPVDGLPQSQINAMVEDHNGYVWIGTEGGGLARFDGREFKVYTTLDGLLTNFVNGLHIDQDQNLWILHARGMTRFDGLRFEKFQLPRSEYPQHLKRICRTSDTLFVFSITGNVSKIHSDSVYYWNKPLSKDFVVVQALQAPGDRIFCLSRDNRMIVIAGKKRFFINVAPDTKLFNLFAHDQDVWVRSDKGTFKVNLQKRSLDHVSLRMDRFVLSYDRKENVFWTRDMNALFREEVNEGGVAVKRDTVLKDTGINQVLHDAEGNTWFASDGRGVFKYFAQDFTRCTADPLRVVMGVLEDVDGALWIGSMAKGLWKIHKGKTIAYMDKKRANRNGICCLALDVNKTLWVGTTDGLGKYDRANDAFTWFTTEDGLSSNRVFNITCDPAGGLWLGTDNGVNHFDGKQFVTYSTTQGLSAKWIRASCYSSYHHTVFLGHEFGVDALVGKRARKIPIAELENTMVLSIHPFRDSLLLLGTGGSGVCIVDPARSKRTTLTTHQGLTSDFVYFAAADEEDNIWVGTEKGITRVRVNDNLEIVENLHYDDSNGLKGLETNQNAFYFGKERKYFGLIDGVYE